jgi:hypothetical protein
MLDLVVRARDIHQISSLYVTKELHEIPYLASHRAVKLESGEVSILEADRERHDDTSADSRQMKVMVLEMGRVVFLGRPDEFESSDLPEVTRMTHPTAGAPSTGSYIRDPWSKNRPKKPEGG